MKNYLHKIYKSLFIVSLTLFTSIQAQIGEVIWEDNFNTLDTNIWTPNIGNGCEIGLCGWGNAELEYYRQENLNIEAIPGESGNNALVLEARRENYEGFEFTSGKVDTEGNLSVHYGMIEIRMRTPSVETGLWPAAWLLGTANLSWPAKGEIDIMEMGHRAEEIANQGHEGTDPDNYVGANAIFANEDGSVGSIAYDTYFNKPYVSNTSMANRFMTYRLYWQPSELRLTVIDNGTEYDLYEGPLPLSSDSVTSAFQKPFFFLLNLAVGGNFTDAAIPGQVTAALPSKLYIDYVRVHKWNGHGTVEFNYSELEPEVGPFGVYTENTPTNNELSFGLDSEIYVWGGTMQDGNTEAYEGSEVIAWETLNTNSWFGGGIASSFGRDMSGYVEEGTLKFNIKIPADVSFRIGITDNYTNEKWLEFPAGETTYGLTRNGEWGQVEIPLVDFAGLIAFQNINYMFAIASLDGAFPSSTFQLGIDNIVWDDGNDIVTTIPVTSVSTSTSSATLEIGETEQLSATVSPNDASNQDIEWSTSNSSVATVSSNGLVTAIAAGNATITVTTVDGNFTDATSITVNEIPTTSNFIPDPNKTYYIDCPIHNLRIAANGSANNPYTTSSNTTGADVEWKFVAKGNGYWHIDRADGGTRPRLRSRNQADADMQATTSSGNWTQYEFAPGFNDGTYFMTLPNGPSNHKRLQVNSTGQVKMVSTDSNRTWESFTFTEVTSTPPSSSIFIEAEDYIAMKDVQTEPTDDDDTLNVGWIDNTDWMDYSINIPSTGVYTITTRVASDPGNAAFQYQVNGNVLGTTNVVSTGGWQNWITLTTNINLSAGQQTLRLYSVGEGFNINWLKIEAQTSSAKAVVSNNSNSMESKISLYPVPAITELNVSLGNNENVTSVEIINLNGSIVLENSQINQDIVTFNTSDLSEGLYIVRVLSSDGGIDIIKFTK